MNTNTQFIIIGIIGIFGSKAQYACTTTQMCTITHTRSHMYLIWRRICVSISWAGPVFGQVLEADSYPSPSRVTARRIQRKIKQVLCEKHCCHLQRFMHIWIGSASCQSAAGRPRIGSQLCALACTADGPFLRVQPVRR